MYVFIYLCMYVCMVFICWRFSDPPLWGCCDISSWHQTKVCITLPVIILAIRNFNAHPKTRPWQPLPGPSKVHKNTGHDQNMYFQGTLRLRVCSSVEQEPIPPHGGKTLSVFEGFPYSVVAADCPRFRWQCQMFCCLLRISLWMSMLATRLQTNIEPENWPGFGVPC